MAPKRVLSHFGVYSLRQAFWELPEEERTRIAGELNTALAGTADSVHMYGTFGTRPLGDGLCWSAVAADDPAATSRFFHRSSEALRPFRRYLRLVDALWGFTGESEYSRGGSDRGIDPFEPRELRYLVVYPFAKTPEWYRLDSEGRRRMMSEHIRVGRGHDGIRQLLLYSTGLQDHEFVVVYETDDLAAFSKLVADLRSTEARGYTLKDTPVHVGMLTDPHSVPSPWQ